VETPSGPGIVTGVYPLKDTVVVELESQAEEEFPVSKVNPLQDSPKMQDAVNQDKPQDEVPQPELEDEKKPEAPEATNMEG